MHGAVYLLFASFGMLCKFQFIEQLCSVDILLSVILTEGSFLYPKSVQKVKGRGFLRGDKRARTPGSDKVR